MQALDPVFDFMTDESDILIHSAPVEVRINQNIYTGRGEVRLILLPRANIYLYGYLKGVPANDILSSSLLQTEISSFSLNSCQIEGFLSSSGGDINSQEFNLKWHPKSEPLNCIGDESTQMQYLIFHLYNFVELIGTRRSIEQNKSYANEHVDLVSYEWNIELKSLHSTQDNFKILKEEGGYRLTHIGGIRKVKDSLFTGREAEECLRTIRLFLSFAKGGWCNPVCAVGFDISGNRVWESWSSPKEPWCSNSSWFDPHNSSQLVTLFPSFIKKCNEEKWQEAIHEVIYWYLNSNYSSRGIDAGIILSQAAIERLSFEYAVEDKRLLTAGGFKALSASDKYRLLFSSLQIPIEIPKETPTLKNLAKKFTWLDAPHALTEIRNSLVHPEHKKRGQLSPGYFEAWNLNLWYLEMGLLAICGYLGTYGNRLKQKWVGQVENIPWAKTDSQ